MGLPGDLLNPLVVERVEELGSKIKVRFSDIHVSRSCTSKLLSQVMVECGDDEDEDDDDDGDDDDDNDDDADDNDH